MNRTCYRAVLAVGLLVMVALSGCAAPPVAGAVAQRATVTATPHSSETVRAWFIGDSLTVGLGNAGEDRGFRALVSAAWRIPWTPDGVPPDAPMSAHGGWTTPQVLTLVRAEPRADVASVQAVIIETGTNDFYHSTQPYAAWQRDYQQLVLAAQAKAPHARLICLGAWAPDAATYDEWIASVCGQTGGHFVLLAPLFEDPRLHDLSGDTFHPNAVAYQDIATMILHG